MKKETARRRFPKFSPNGSRTRVTAVRGRRPRPLDDRAALWLPGMDSNHQPPDSESGAQPVKLPGTKARCVLFFRRMFLAANVSVWLWQFGHSIRRFSSRWSSRIPLTWSIWMEILLPLHSLIPHSSQTFLSIPASSKRTLIVRRLLEFKMMWSGFRCGRGARRPALTDFVQEALQKPNRSMHSS
jgi:hypothetical protein